MADIYLNFVGVKSTRLVVNVCPATQTFKMNKSCHFVFGAQNVPIQEVNVSLEAHLVPILVETKSKVPFNVQK